jgi:uncharacterized membrane protein
MPGRNRPGTQEEYMSDPTHLHLIVCTFDAVSKADMVRHAIQTWDKRLDTVKLGNIAVVQRDADGKVSFRETQDVRQELGTVTGTVVGGLAWFLYAFAGSFGPIAANMASYQAEEAVYGLVKDSGFPDDALRAIGEELDTGSSALITLVRPEEEALVVDELEKLGGTIVRHPIPPDIVEQLKQHGAS